MIVNSISKLCLAIAVVLSLSGTAVAFEEGDPIELPWVCTTPSDQIFTVPPSVAERINDAGGEVTCEPFRFAPRPRE